MSGRHSRGLKGCKSRDENALVHRIAEVKIEDFYNIDNFGVEYTRRCGGCKRGKWSSIALNVDGWLHIHGQETRLIFQTIEWPRSECYCPQRACQEYWPCTSISRADTRYDRQALFARKPTESELETNDWPTYYVSHHEVANPDSKSTPVRIVLNSSAKYMGHTLNEYWAKGLELVNSLLGVLIRFREHEVTLIGDIKENVPFRGNHPARTVHASVSVKRHGRQERTRHLRHTVVLNWW